MIITDMLKSQNTSNLKFNGIISDIIHNIIGNQIQVHHCYRETNQVAIFFAKLAASNGNDTFYHSFNNFLSK